MYNVGIIEEIFTLTAQQTIESMGYKLAPNCENALRVFMKGGAINISKVGFSHGILGISEATRSIELLVKRMIEEAQNEGQRELHETSLMKAQKGLCPLFPFC